MYGHILYHKEEHSAYVQSLLQDPRIRLVSSVEMFGFVPFLSGLVGFVQCIFEQTLINAENPKFVHVSKTAFETCVMKRFRANARYTPMRFPVLPTTFNFRLPPPKGRSNYPQGKRTIDLSVHVWHDLRHASLPRWHAGTLDGSPWGRKVRLLGMDTDLSRRTDLRGHHAGGCVSVLGVS